VALPDRPAEAITHQHLLRSMDALMEHREAVDRVVARLLRPLIDQERSVVFYDLTTLRAEGDATVAGDVRRFGMAKEGVLARQFLLATVAVVVERVKINIRQNRYLRHYLSNSGGHRPGPRLSL
jgi:hypothetical protein